MKKEEDEKIPICLRQSLSKTERVAGQPRRPKKQKKKKGFIPKDKKKQLTHSLTKLYSPPGPPQHLKKLQIDKKPTREK